MLLWGFINSAYYWTNKSMGHGNFRGWKPANQLVRGNGCNGTLHSERSVQMVLSICHIYLTHYSTNIGWQETSIVAKAGVRSCGRNYLDDSWSQAWTATVRSSYLLYSQLTIVKGWRYINLFPIDLPDILPDGAWLESFLIALPSTLPQQSSNHLLLTWLLKAELELRKGHANDCLAAICTIIGQEAFQYKKILWPAHDKVHWTRAQSSIQTVHRTLILQLRLYQRTRKAMLSLNMELSMLDTIYKELTWKDIQVSSVVASPNVASSSWMHLSWIWTTHQGVAVNDNHLTECEFQLTNSFCTWPRTVYQVHWLWARAQLHHISKI